MNYMLISELAELVGRHPQNIRELEWRGVLPEPKRDSSGRRIYTSADALRIRSILYPHENAELVG